MEELLFALVFIDLGRNKPHSKSPDVKRVSTEPNFRVDGSMCEADCYFSLGIASSRIQPVRVLCITLLEILWSVKLRDLP
jgi:hypothetical protein